MSFVGGKLKLKGGDPRVSKKKKKKKTPVSNDVEEGAPEAQEAKASLEGYAIAESTGEGVDRRTEAEKRFEEKMLEAEKKRLAKLAHTSHRDRVRDFNEKLAQLSEHHDIPKVGPG